MRRERTAERPTEDRTPPLVAHHTAEAADVKGAVSDRMKIVTVAAVGHTSGGGDTVMTAVTRPPAEAKVVAVAVVVVAVRAAAPARQTAA